MFVDVGTPLVARVVTLATETQVRDYIAQTPAALALVDQALVDPLHVAAYEGVGCTRTNIRNGTYPAVRPLGVVTRGRAARRARPLPALGEEQRQGAPGDQDAVPDPLRAPAGTTRRASRASARGGGVQSEASAGSQA